MCCEQLECYVAVFDHAEAVCYLKGETAMNTANFVSETGFTTFEMFFREGPAAGTHVVLPFFAFSCAHSLFSGLKTFGLSGGGAIPYYQQTTE